MTSIYDTEYLKALLAKGQPKTFYLHAARTPGATYKVLFARLRPLLSMKRFCKVDVLIPGVLNIPHIDNFRILRIDGLPVMPLLPLLLLKLQGWSDHRASTRLDMQQKQYVDIRDINQLLQIVVEKKEDVRRATWLPQTFVAAGQEMLSRYLAIVRPASMQLWQNIGFDIGQFAV